MNLLNTLLDQPVILITLGLAWLIFVVAIGIQFIQLIRLRLRQRQRRQAAEAARQIARKRARAKAIAEMKAQAAGDNDAPNEAVVQESATQPEPVNAPAEPEVSTEMQSLLSDVFVDETAAARYAILIDGLEEVDAQDLSRALQAVAEQLRHARDIA